MNAVKEMTFMIQQATLLEKEMIRKIVKETIEVIYPKYYSLGVVQFFLNHHKMENIEKDILLGNVYILCIDNQYIGTITIQENEINRLFLLPKYQKQGYGKMLLRFGEEQILKKYSQVHLDASLPAKGMYKKFGYQEVEYHEYEVENGDVLCYEVMEKTLVQDNASSHRASEYDKKILQTIPFYTEFHNQTMDIIKEYKANATSWLDIGCGTGILENLIVEQWPNAQIVAIDPSQEMLKQAKKNVQSKYVQFICEYSQNIDYEDDFDVITAIQVNHYLQKNEREQVIQNVYRALKQDGIFISFENVKPSEESLLETELQRWGSYQQKSGKTIEQVEKHLQRCGVNYFPISVEEHIQLLTENGFSKVYVFWKSYFQMGIMGVK